MTDTLRLEGGGREVDLYSWLNQKAKGTEALAGIVGFGLPGVTNFWTEGAGSDSSFRGARVNRRVIDLPLRVYAADRRELNEILSDLSIILDPLDKRERVARLYFGLPDDAEWFVDVVRAGGGDWARKVDSDDRTYFKTTLQLEGDSFWTRNDPESFTVEVDSSGATLLPYMARLRVSSASAFGVQDVTNIGDTSAWPVFTVNGPTTRVTLVGADGETVDWRGSLTESESLLIDMRNALVIDGEGDNRYDGLSPAPKFWSIGRGDSQVTVQAENTTASTVIIAQWWPRRWAVV